MLRTRFIVPISLGSLAALTTLLLPMGASALSGVPGAPGAQAERCEPASQSLPTLRVELCAECNMHRDEIEALRQAYAESAQSAGHDIDFLTSARVRITETGLLENGTPYAIGEAGGMRFRVGDPHPGATLGSALGRMTYAIFSGAWKNMSQESLK